MPKSLTPPETVTKSNSKRKRSENSFQFLATSTPSGKTSNLVNSGNISTETMPPTRAGTPLSPLSEKLFGDILDAEPPTHPFPGLNYWSDSDGENGEDEPKAKRCKIAKCSPSTPIYSTDDESGGTSATVAETAPTSTAPSDAARTTEKTTEVASQEPDIANATRTTKEGFQVIESATTTSTATQPTNKILGTPLHKALMSDSSHSAENISENINDVLALTDPESFESSKSLSNSSSPESQSSQNSEMIITYPVFCSNSQRLTNYSASRGIGLDGRGIIEAFMSLTAGGELSSSSVESVYEALSKTQHIFEVKIDACMDIPKTIYSPDKRVKGKKQVETKDVELTRYFVPSAVYANLYLEIHAEDVYAGLNPSTARMGNMEGKWPSSTYKCSCPGDKFDSCHAIPRTITLLKNHLYRAPVSRRPAREVTGEWLVGGASREWGMPLNDARTIWKLM